MQANRIASAISYLERGFELDPSHFGVRRALGELGRKPKAPPRPMSHVPSSIPEPNAKKS
jgi:hypothetical protein